MTVIGLTGPSGSGKTSLCLAALEMGCYTINADDVYHALLVPPSECLNDIVGAFGDEVLNEDGTLNRKKLGNIVFSDDEKLSKLNFITHRYVKERFREIISEMRDNDVQTVIIDAPTLFESGFDTECDITVCLLATRDLREKRIISRDHLTKERADSRLSAQKNDDYFKSRADYTLYNNGSADDLKKELERFLARITEGNARNDKRIT